MYFSLGDHYFRDIIQRNGVRQAHLHRSKHSFKSDKWLNLCLILFLHLTCIQKVRSSNVCSYINVGNVLHGCLIARKLTLGKLMFSISQIRNQTISCWSNVDLYRVVSRCQLHATYCTLSRVKHFLVCPLTVEKIFPEGYV